METKRYINERQTRSKRQAQNRKTSKTPFPSCSQQSGIWKRKIRKPKFNSNRSKTRAEEKQKQHEAREEETRQTRE